MPRVYFLFFAISLFSNLLKAQDRFYSTRNYTAVNGLPQSQVIGMLEDKNGYLWVGTEGGGLARFDGREFKVYTTLDGLLTNQVNGLHMDKGDKLWILHPRGFTKFDGLNFTKFQSPETDPSSPTRMWRMFEIKDTLFVLSGRNRITKLYNDSIYYWERPLEKEIRRMHIGPNGEACFYFSDSSFHIRLQNKTVEFKPDVALPGVFNFFNYKSDVLFRTKDGVYKLDVENKKVLKMPWNTDNYVLFYDEKNDVLWTGNTEGLLRERIKPDDVKREIVIRDIEANQILMDSEGNTWIGTNGNGLYKYFIQDFKQYPAENIRGVMAIERDKEGALWVGTMYKGLWRIKNGEEHSYADEKNSYRNMVSKIKESPSGEIWVGTWYGLGRYNKIKDSFRWYVAEDSLPSVSIKAIEFDKRGMWVGTSNGLSYFNGETFKNYKIKDGLSNNGVSALHYSHKQETLYIGTHTLLNTFRKGKIEALHVPELINTSILTLESYKDSLLLIATSGGGVVILNPSTKKRKLLTTREGLASDFIYFAAADDQNYIWIGTEKGINRVLLDNQLEMVENLHFNYDNGLTGVETNQNSFYLTPETKYFGLVDGLYEFNDQRNQPSKSFDLHLTNIQILYGEYAARDYADSTFGFFKIPHYPLFPPSRNHITFNFNRVDKRYSKSVMYKYFLENFDKKWSQPSSVNYVTYSNLPPGDYIFRVMGTNSEGSWAKTEIAYPFTIKTPFYRTASFMVGMFIFIGGLATLILYIRVKQRISRAMMLEQIRQREQDAIRKEIARDFHDEMGNQLSRIINYVSLLKLNGNGSANGRSSEDLYTKVEDSAKYLYTGTRDFIWSIDPINDELSQLFIHIRDFGEKLFEEKNINFRAFDEVKDKIKLPYGFCRQANLIFKEAMTNAFKYSEAKNVTLTIKRDENNQFEMSLEDDGIGFYTDDIQKSNGLQNIRERADRINGVLRIQSEKDLGTKICLTFNLTKTLKYGLAF